MAAPRFGVAHVLARTFAIWLRNLLPFTVLTLIICSPRLVFAFASRSRFEVAELLTFLLIDPFVHTVVTAALIFGVFERLRGRAAGIGACLRTTLSRLLPVLGVALSVQLVAI